MSVGYDKQTVDKFVSLIKLLKSHPSKEGAVSALSDLVGRLRKASSSYAPVNDVKMTLSVLKTQKELTPAQAKHTAGDLEWALHTWIDRDSKLKSVLKMTKGLKWTGVQWSVGESKERVSKMKDKQIEIAESVDNFRVLAGLNAHPHRLHERTEEGSMDEGSEEQLIAAVEKKLNNMQMTLHGLKANVKGKAYYKLPEASEKLLKMAQNLVMFTKKIKRIGVQGSVGESTDSINKKTVRKLYLVGRHGWWTWKQVQMEYPDLTGGDLDPLVKSEIVVKKGSKFKLTTKAKSYL